MDLARARVKDRVKCQLFFRSTEKLLFVSVWHISEETRYNKNSDLSFQILSCTYPLKTLHQRHALAHLKT